eukprot:621633_1
MLDHHTIYGKHMCILILQSIVLFFVIALVGINKASTSATCEQGVCPDDTSHNTNDENEQFITEATQLIFVSEINGMLTYNINQEALNIISSNFAYSNQPFEVISVIGQARKGKSYTMSKIMQQLAHPSPSFMPFESSSFNKPFTRGIWMYLLRDCTSISKGYLARKEAKSYPCAQDNKPYLLLDIQGSYTESDDEAMRYASIVALISTQTYLFLHQKLYKHDIDQIRYISSFVHEMNEDKLAFEMSDINLGAIIREPFNNEFNNVEKAVNDDLSLYTHYFVGFEQFTVVKSIPNHHEHSQYDKSMQDIAKTIVSMGNEKKTASRMNFVTYNFGKFKTLLIELVDQFNNNQNVSRICIVCVFKRIVEWGPFTEWSKCNKNCDGGLQKRSRKCNSENDGDCERFIGGKAVETKACNTFKCEWKPWGKWSECTKACSGGKQSRRRECITDDIQDCIEAVGGSNTERRTCNTQKCKWIKDREGPCSVKCNGGTQIIYKKCESGFDVDCEGDSQRTISCNKHKCRWTETTIGRCSVSCGSGDAVVYRTCESGIENDCDGQSKYMETCFNWLGCVWYLLYAGVAMLCCIGAAGAIYNKFKH